MMIKNKIDKVMVLEDARLKTNKWVPIQDIVITKEGQKVINLLENVNKLNDKIIELSKAIININDSLNSFKKEHNKLVNGYKKQIAALKTQIATINNGGKI
ncbi:MAG: hypothetical protein ACI35S_05245 [Anaeroplasma sp.]